MNKILLISLVCLLVLLLATSEADAQGCGDPDGCIVVTDVSLTIRYNITRVEGHSSAYADYTAGLNWHPRVDGAIYRTDFPETDLDFDTDVGSGSSVPAVINLMTTNFVNGKTYCNYSNFFAVSRSTGQTVYLPPALEDCKTISVSSPTPTPTPVPTATPTPTPTPTPNYTVAIEEVGFEGGFPINRFATGDPITNPVWRTGGITNPKNYVAYKKGTEIAKMKLSANLKVTPAPSAGSLTARVRVKHAGNPLATQTTGSTVNGDTIVVTNLAVSEELEEAPKVKKGTYDFSWEVSFDDGGTWKPAGSSQHPIYWTFGDVVESSTCVLRECLFVNSLGSQGHQGLYDKALEKAIDELVGGMPDPPDPDPQTPDAIARRLAWNIDNQINYNTRHNPPDFIHPLFAYNSGNGVQCAVNANLLRGLLRSIGINNSEAVYIWGGKPNNTEKKENETGGSTYWYRFHTTSTSTGDQTDGHATFQAIRPESNEGSLRLRKDPHFIFHAMVKVFDGDGDGPNNLNSRYYDPSYAKRLEANPGRYSHPDTNNDLKFKLAANLGDPVPRRHRYVEDDATKPFIVRALKKNWCLPLPPGSTICGPDTKIKDGVRNDSVAAIPSTSVFDAQGMATFTVWRPSDGVWYTRNAYDNTYGPYLQFGTSGDIPASADFDGDGITDHAVYRPSNQAFYIWESDSSSLRSYQWSSDWDIPVYGDFDGDGKADIAFYRHSVPSKWFLVSSEDGSVVSYDLGGWEDRPVAGDFDGDGKSDIAVFHYSGTWLWRRSSDGVQDSRQWGQSGDIPVSGDYDGDGKTDSAIFRPSDGTWLILRSSDGSHAGAPWGTGTDIPVPGDYDGDGKTDLAVWRPSDGGWWVYGSFNGEVISDIWGSQSNGDFPIGQPLTP